MLRLLTFLLVTSSLFKTYTTNPRKLVNVYRPVMYMHRDIHKYTTHFYMDNQSSQYYIWQITIAGTLFCGIPICRFRVYCL